MFVCLWIVYLPWFQRRYFVITKGELAYFDSEALSKRMGSMPLNTETVINTEAGEDGYQITILNAKVRCKRRCMHAHKSTNPLCGASQSR